MLLQLDISELLFSGDFEYVNRGGIAEQFIGLEIMKNGSCYTQNELFYWHRESGKKGSMNSMFLFLKENKAKYGCRLSLENFAEYGNIKVYPLYALDNILGRNQGPD